ncbi:MAG: hypothetical protein ABSD28_17320 [Tepidisphaeraceae bacterium]|jgi:hypothetical protein
MSPTQSPSSAHVGLRLFGLSFAALFLELMMIRWVPAVIRLVAYYGNLMLISSFLGLGLGAMLARGTRNLLSLFPLVLLIDIGLLVFGGSRFIIPNGSSEARFYNWGTPSFFNYAGLIAVFILNTAIFVPLGQEIGRLFRAQLPLRAYAFDLGGSLCGTLLFGLFSVLHFSPLFGVVAVAVIFVLATWRRVWLWSLPLFPLALIIAPIATDANAIWSPYYYVTVHKGDSTVSVAEPVPGIRTMQNPPVYKVRVNNDFYQTDGTINPNRYSSDMLRNGQNLHSYLYRMPYILRANPRQVCVVGAGGGIDVEAALLAGAAAVDAIEIDPGLVKIADRFNAADVYDDPRVSLHVNDARAFFQSAHPVYDAIVFGSLDSQALFSYSANIRLDGFIYTVESFRRAYSLLRPDGVLAVSFAVAQPWMVDKLQGMVAQVTGNRPLVYHHNVNFLFFASPNPALLASAPANIGPFLRLDLPLVPIDLSTDDWPYLYISHRSIPRDYLLVIASLVILSVGAVFIVRGSRGPIIAQFNALDGHFFFLGLAFLLLETTSISNCSLYFGTTWLVTMIVVAGVLLMVLAANFVAMRLSNSPRYLYVPLFLSLALVYFLRPDFILGLPFAGRLAWALLGIPLPIFFAGLIFSTTFRQTHDPSLSFSANLIGATLGGFLQYLAMAVGMHVLLVVVIASYAASLACRELAGVKGPRGPQSGRWNVSPQTPVIAPN